MDDLTTMLSQVLSDPASMRQLQSVAESLGLAGGGNAAAPEPQPSPQEPSPPASSGGLDLGALSSLLGTQQAAAPQPGGVDLSALSGILGGLMGGQNQPGAPSEPGAQNAASALAALLGQTSGQATAGSTGLPFDVGTLLKLRQAMSGLQANQANVQLLMALKPRLKPDRAKKVDDAVRVMQLIQFLPLIKESGLFGDLGGVLGGLLGGRRQP